MTIELAGCDGIENGARPDLAPMASETEQVYELTRRQHEVLREMADPKHAIGYFKHEAMMRKFTSMGLAEERFVRVYLRTLWFRTPAGDRVAGQEWRKRITLQVEHATEIGN